MADATFKAPEKAESSATPIQSLSPSASNHCVSCFRHLLTIPGHPKDVKRRLWFHSKEGDEGLVLIFFGKSCS